jgi:hypothetical protein
MSALARVDRVEGPRFGSCSCGTGALTCVPLILLLLVWHRRPSPVVAGRSPVGVVALQIVIRTSYFLHSCTLNPMLPRLLLIASAAVILVFGIIHLLYTFRGPKLTPRNPALRARMEQVSPVISAETTMWKAWIGFNATHSLALILFGVVYGYLAVANFELLMQSQVLLAIGLAMLIALVVLAKLYFFSVPFRGVCMALGCYVAGVVVSRVSPG